jgi:hypothetical protein
VYSAGHPVDNKLLCLRSTEVSHARSGINPGNLGKYTGRAAEGAAAASHRVRVGNAKHISLDFLEAAAVVGAPGVWPVSEDTKPLKKRLRSRTRALPPRPRRTELERACRIALVEAEEPVSVEAIYERIVRRGSVNFFSYKRPFRAIALAMSSLTKKGEVILVVDRGSAGGSGRGDQRRWRRSILNSSPDRFAGS